jgi:hypothetical protein
MTSAKNFMYAFMGLAALGAAQGLLEGQIYDTCGLCAPAAPSCAPPAPPTAECTVLAPQVVTEYRTMTVTRSRQETRRRTVYVNKEVPRVKDVEEEYTVIVPEVRTRTVEDTISRPVYNDIVLRKTKMSPEIEARQATRTVCKLVSFQEERTVYDIAPEPVAGAATPPPPPAQSGPPPRGAANDAPCPTCPAPACAACPSTAALLPRTVSVTCTRPVSQQETIEYPVAHLKPDVRMETVSFYEFKPEKTTREEQYTVDVPQKKVRTRQVTVMRTISVPREEQYTVNVPYQEQVRVPVLVLRWVPRTIKVPAAPVCDACGG